MIERLTIRAPEESPWPSGHALQASSAVCICGRSVLDCQPMTQWAADRRALLQAQARRAEDAGFGILVEESA